MSEHSLVLSWQRGSEVFTDRRYSRKHSVAFDGGLTVPYSSSPSVVRVPLSDPTAVDPEESLIAALASCHMLWFLDFAARAGFCVDSYRDEASGSMSKNENGKLFVSHIVLKPMVVFSGETVPDEKAYLALHHAAHEECFIANSLKSEVSVAAQMQRA
ncbi:MAG: OsmC family protein [Burkholderiales bacterium]|nr:OsmC family protein [Burkholderiales bacterium]